MQTGGGRQRGKQPLFAQPYGVGFHSLVRDESGQMVEAFARSASIEQIGERLRTFHRRESAGRAFDFVQNGEWSAGEQCAKLGKRDADERTLSAGQPAGVEMRDAGGVMQSFVLRDGGE